MNRPNQADEYRRARDELLQAEIELRRQEEAVAAQRRALPLGGEVTGDNAESDEAGQFPVAHVFTRTAGRIHHRSCSEPFAAPRQPGQDPRHVDDMWPIWKVLDATRDGCAAGWRPRYRYHP
jgi:predicted dithiol-disulfide oxidoreductase (DUF899 family)